MRSEEQERRAFVEYLTDATLAENASADHVIKEIIAYNPSAYNAWMARASLSTPPDIPKGAVGVTEDKCSGCNGNGEVGGLRPDGYDSQECPFCHGTGKASEDAPVSPEPADPVIGIPTSGISPASQPAEAVSEPYCIHCATPGHKSRDCWATPARAWIEEALIYIGSPSLAREGRAILALAATPVAAQPAEDESEALERLASRPFPFTAPKTLGYRFRTPVDEAGPGWEGVLSGWKVAATHPSDAVDVTPLVATPSEAAAVEPAKLSACNFCLDQARQARDDVAAKVDAERERCAACADDFAAMMENGAGELEPGQRFRQLARKIRSGDAPLGTAKFYPAAAVEPANVPESYARVIRFLRAHAEHGAADRLESRFATMAAEPVAPAKGAFSCRLCGQATPHHHSEFEQLMAMSEAEIDAELRANGIEPDDAVRRANGAIEAALSSVAEPVEGAEPVKLKGRAAIVEAWNNLDHNTRTLPGLDRLYRACLACDDVQNPPRAEPSDEQIDSLYWSGYHRDPDGNSRAFARAVLTLVAAPDKFPETYCSQCGGKFGPGNQGYSRCADHPAPASAQARAVPEDARDAKRWQTFRALTADQKQSVVFIAWPHVWNEPLMMDAAIDRLAAPKAGAGESND